MRWSRAYYRAVTQCTLLTLAALCAVSDVLAADSATPEIAMREFLENETRNLGDRVEIEIDAFDPREQLATCQKVQPFLPPGTPLRGKITLGVRCTAGARWSVYRTARIKLFGKVLVSSRALSAGQIVTSNDYRIQEAELSLQPGSALRDPAAAHGKIALRNVDAGQVLRREQLRIKPIIAQGDPVRISYAGAGFAVTTDGKALAQAEDGQRVRVQADTGRVLTGVARPGRMVEVRF